MPALVNPKHERLAQELANGLEQSEAYMLATGGKNRAAARASASRLLAGASGDAIRKRVAEILAQRETIRAKGVAKAIEKTAATEEWIINKLIENVERASTAEPVLDSKGNPTGEYRYDGAVVNRSLELLGKQRGMFIDRKEIRTSPLASMSPDELRALDAVLAGDESGDASGDSSAAVH